MFCLLFSHFVACAEFSLCRPRAGTNTQHSIVSFRSMLGFFVCLCGFCVESVDSFSVSCFVVTFFMCRVFLCSFGSAPFSPKPLARLPCLLCYFHLENLCMGLPNALKWFFLVQHSGFQIQLSIQHSCKLHLFRKKNFWSPLEVNGAAGVRSRKRESAQHQHQHQHQHQRIYTIRSTKFCGNEPHQR